MNVQKRREKVFSLKFTFLYKICHLLGFVPLYDFKNFKEIKSNLYGIYSGVILGLIIASFIYNIYNPYSTITDLYYLIILKAFSSLVHLMCIIAITNCLFINKKKWIIFLRLLRETHYEDMNNDLYSKLLSVSIYMMLFFMIVYYSFLTYLHIIRSASFNNYFFAVEEIFVIILSLKISYFTCIIRNRYKYLNKEMLKPVFYLNKHLHTKTFHIVKIHNELGKLVEVFNEIFSLIMLIYMGLILIQLVDGFMIFMSGKDNIIDAYLTSFLRFVCMNDVLKNFHFSVYFQAQGIILIYSGSKANDEIINIGKTAFNIILESSPNTVNQDYLLTVALNISLKHVQITAGSTLAVNMSVFFALVASAVSYIIIILQFKGQC